MSETQNLPATNYRLDQVARTVGAVVAVVVALAMFLLIADRIVRLLIGFVRSWLFVFRLIIGPLGFLLRLLVRGIKILLPLLKRESIDFIGN